MAEQRYVWTVTRVQPFCSTDAAPMYQPDDALEREEEERRGALPTTAKTMIPVHMSVIAKRLLG